MNCPHCGKKLRVDNTRGACSACLAKPANRRSSAPTPETAPDPEAVPPPSSALIRLRSVAAFLEIPGDALLERAVEEFLSRLLGRIAVPPPAAPVGGFHVARELGKAIERDERKPRPRKAKAFSYAEDDAPSAGDELAASFQHENAADAEAA